MPNYVYHGLDEAGKKISSTVEADSEKSAKQKLKKAGIFITKLQQKGRGDKKKNSSHANGNEVVAVANKIKVKLKDLSDITRQLATLVKANVPLVEALGAIQEQLEDEKFQDIISNVKAKVNEGTAIAKAMAEYPKVFSPLYTSMIRAGEASGSLHIVLVRLADFIEKNLKLRNKIISSLVYPAILGVVSLIIISGLLTFVVPKLTEMFQDQGKALPTITIVLIWISTVFKNYWYVLFSAAATFIYLFKKYIATPKGRRWLDRKLITFPVVGMAIKKIAISRFARTLSTLLSSGVPLVASLEIVKSVVDNILIGESIEEVKKGVKEGKPIAKNLKASGFFPPIVTHMIAIGEKSGGKELEEIIKRMVIQCTLFNLRL